MPARQERGPLRIEEEDGSPSVVPVTIKVSNDSLTDNGDGTVSVNVSGNDPIYFGSATSDGSWRISTSGNNLIFERRESSVWVTKGSFDA